jgi:hypothetical protein
LVVTIVDARRLTALGAWLIAMAAAAGPAWSEPAVLARAVAESPLRVDTPRVQRASLRSTDWDVVAVEPPAQPPADPSWLLLSADVADREATDLRSLLADRERWRLVEFGAAATWRPLAAKVTAFGQLPYVSTGVLDATTFDEVQEPASLGVRGEVEGFEAGAQYRSVGKRLERLIGGPAAHKDREGHELWVAHRLGPLKLRLADSELTDNVDRNPALPRTTKDQDAVTAELALSAWPVLGLTYAAGDSARVRLTPQGREGAPERHDFESVTSSLYYYGGPGWEVTTSSTLSQSRHVLRAEEETTATYHDLSLTLRLLDGVTAIPALSLGQERALWSDVHTDTSTAALTLTYAPAASRWWASTYASYTTTRASDGSTEGRAVSLSGALTCALGKLLPLRSTVSFEAGYDRYDDAVVPAGASRAISGFVLLKVAGF